jgi:hypothetical protein
MTKLGLTGPRVLRSVVLAVLFAACVGPSPQPTPAPSVSASGSSDVCHQAGGTAYCALNPAVTQATIKQTICRSGWTRTVRPPASYTDQLKAQQIHDLGLAGNLSDYEEDHRVPLELGGAPRDPLNLTPESHSSSFQKDADENTFKQHICAGRLSLLAAQDAFISKWLGPWPQYKQ